MTQCIQIISTERDHLAGATIHFRLSIIIIAILQEEDGNDLIRMVCPIIHHKGCCEKVRTFFKFLKNVEDPGGMSCI